jgi:small GTP-binding protein
MNIDSDFETLIKLSIIGDSSVGKSNFLFKFIEGQFSPLHVATIGFDYKSRIVTLPESKKKVKLQIWDTAGQEKYMSINKNLFQRVQGVILMYDITKHETFEHLDTWLNLIKQMTNDIPIVLVGNKLDQEDSIENGRAVEYTEGEDFARENNFEFFETSALDGTNVDKIFSTIAEKVLKSIQEGRTNSSINLVPEKKSDKKKKKKCC